jgi:hypothetical protein
MNTRISHNRNDETMEAKTRWFSSLPLSQRMELFCTYTDMALSANPQLRKKDAESIKRRVLVVSKT